MDNATIARQLYEAWNGREFDRNAGCITDDGEIVIVGSGIRFRGPNGMRQFDNMWADGFPDGAVNVNQVVADGDTVVVQSTGRGTHIGALLSTRGEIPATGRPVTLELVDVLRFENGKICSLRRYFDSASLMAQLGVMPEAGVASI
jgi:steroid delta-isomerase-like uncharacterized protein